MPTDIDKLRIVRVEDTVQETPTIKTLVFQDNLSNSAYPGQFLMVWSPRVEELPMSIMVHPKKGYAAITVRRHGIGSTSLYEKKIGEQIGIRGPYGNSFKINRNPKQLLIGGGTGLVPLVRLITRLKEISGIELIFIMGSKSKEEVFFEDKVKHILSNVKSKVIVTTEDGSYGLKGNVIDALTEQINTDRIDQIYTCGPELMMKKVFDLCQSNSIPIQASIERYMKCGIGICASCCINDKLVCTDGTIFSNKQLSRMSDFGNYYRDKSGKKIKYLL